MTEFNTCEICGCKYAQTILTNGQPHPDTSCPAERIGIHNIPTMLRSAWPSDRVWIERMFAHFPHLKEEYAV